MAFHGLPPKLGAAAAPLLPFSEGPLPVPILSSVYVDQLCVESFRSIVTAAICLQKKFQIILEVLAVA